ncbi:non-hydrolyzing UDP-N-acetylglucosamine 2-epimerase [Deinococcus soli (ex Cha et al. 2016)]|uniref:UDP-N-acetylglucosamine 2-epimerase (Non-hydrolyzing) n=2 Tax=Deinococcus soli (ex Cha et al. 2016) TaxID=1309411 RepID=A0ACC6KDE5_9DEIO|nr:UDP-N-acetylglucosamine 2-epimerase (non-hydrolyzing) [Deinococcus soli (ex Cha et al. 2016)]MDR6217469.1 UDP-N-acetylglucosamine 2-epimerase (non-hydrolyzing) [Deinococcus soli (ex Cha et al. 2016)]MDR6326778.1 UDP-N-acetylglucosamine 2-epimerase (non-hydrolyzing) [Deinococcus soli (ex Cha et al. 2016)]MDR6750495.1 UDP-N-acetylglucosamine 2-epimerase (non-hydrolyzing) [Deinococcus soli (ex Cha et al. 2016)]
MKKIVLAFGTRPEATKMAPVYRAVEAQSGLKALILSTGQQRQMLDGALNVFGLTPDRDLNVMTDRQTLADLTARIVPQAGQTLREMGADMVLVHGDTSTSFCVALSAFYEGIPVGHVEAGLRSGSLREPFPEEANRRLTGVLSTLDFAPTAGSKANLLREGKAPDGIVVTGQTAVDAVREVAGRVPLRAAWQARVDAGQPLVTVTMHRRENQPMMREMAQALARVAQAHPDHHFIYPVHLSPAVQEAVRPALEGVANFELTDPLDYSDMAPLMAASRLLATDSGGLQEEGAALGVPVAVLRNVTERPEGVEAGVLRLAGNDPAQLEATLLDLLGSDSTLAAMRAARNPYGDGQAAQRIAQAIAWHFGLAERPADWT